MEKPEVSPGRAMPSRKTGRRAKRCLQAQLSTATWNGAGPGVGRGVGEWGGVGSEGGPGTLTGREPKEPLLVESTANVTCTRIVQI